MRIVYVKHYLTENGIHFLTQNWFPKVYAMMSQQEGFRSFTHDQIYDGADCVNLTVQFIDEATLNAWVAFPGHDNVIAELDAYRSRKYWEYAVTEDVSAPRSALSWQLVELTALPLHSKPTSQRVK